MKPVPTTAARSLVRSAIARRSYEVAKPGAYDRPVNALEGKAALVTGAAGGIGSGVVRAFAAAGARVLAVDRVDAQGEETYVGDLTRADEAEGAVAAALERFGRLDVLFNGAGISGRSLGDGPVDSCTDEAWDAVLETNLKSVFLCSKHAIPALRRTGGGAIVNLSSVLGLVGSEDFATHAYAASKGAIVALTRAMAIAYAPEGIRCNVVCPGLVDTPMSERARNDPQIQARLGQLQPLTGEPGRPEDVAGAALYLATAPFVTGAVLAVDGGWTAR
ncbi:MAG: SDR family oxidoreductase [Actinobacteria bacterium]|nr:MAG: SDR family oxidoreductase [Actinomycetota bacterium]